MVTELTNRNLTKTMQTPRWGLFNQRAHETFPNNDAQARGLHNT